MVAERIRALRLRRGLTQETLGARAGLERVYVVRLEGGRLKASTSRVRRALAAAFEVDFEAFDRYLDGDIAIESLLSATRRARRKAA